MRFARIAPPYAPRVVTRGRCVFEAVLIALTPLTAGAGDTPAYRFTGDDSRADEASPAFMMSVPLKLIFRTPGEAARACQAMAARVGGRVVRTSGSHSMEPLIRGRAFVVVSKQPYETIRRSDLLLYLGRLDPRSPKRTCTLHRAVLRDRHGWLMSGDNNRWSESWDRVTPKTYLGKVVMIANCER